MKVKFENLAHTLPKHPSDTLQSMKVNSFWGVVAMFFQNAVIGASVVCVVATVRDVWREKVIEP